MSTILASRLSFRMMLKSIEALMSVDIEELRANEDWRGDVTSKQQEDETPQEYARGKDISLSAR